MSQSWVTKFFWSLVVGVGFGVGAITAPGVAALMILVAVFLGTTFLFIQSKKFRHTSMWVGFMCGALLGLWRGGESLELLQQEDYQFLFGEEVEVIGEVVAEPDERLTNTKLTITPKEVCSSEYCVTSDQNILVTISVSGVVSYGDLLWVQGRLEEPENFVSDTGREFDYVHYLAKDNVRALVHQPEFEIIDREYGSKIHSSLINLKGELVQGLDSIMPQPHGALGAGIVFGEKQALGPELQDKFRKTGLMHIVVLSGYNVTIVADSIVRALGFLGGLASFSLGVVGIVTFALMVGAGPTVVRASIMALLVLVARFTGRETMVTRSLLLAGVIMVVQNPLVLWYDISFQLSFLATLGLIYVSPYVEPKLTFIPKALQLREHATATLAAQIAVLPLLIHSMGELSIISPVANLLVLPVIPLGMLLTFITSLLGIFSKTLAAVAMLPTAAVLEYALWITELLAKLPFAVFTF